MNKDTIVETLSRFSPNPPEDLVNYFHNRDAPRSEELFINPLSVYKAVEYAEALRDHAIIGSAFGLIPLADGNNSNPFCYITKGPATGCIMNFMHDDRAKISHRTIQSYVDSTAVAISYNIYVDDMPRDNRIFRPNIDQYIQNLPNDEVSLMEACLLVTLLDTEDYEIIEKYSNHSDLYIREAIAIHLIDHPETKFEEMAIKLSKDEEFEVSYSAKLALKAIRTIKAN